MNRGKKPGYYAEGRAFTKKKFVLICGSTLHLSRQKKSEMGSSYKLRKIHAIATNPKLKKIF